MEEIKEQTYPIYCRTAQWLEPKDPQKEYPESWTKDAPEGKFWNSCISRYQGYREEPTTSQLEKEAREWWERYLQKHPEVSNPIIIILFVEKETWWITWFQHETFDTGQSNEEVLASFQRYIQRKEDQARREGKDPEYYLMGAGDKWRWHGAEPDGKPEDRSDPPCRCKHCKEQGIIRIAH